MFPAQMEQRGHCDIRGLTNWQRYDIILLSVSFDLRPWRQTAAHEPEIWEKEQEIDWWKLQDNGSL